MFKFISRILLLALLSGLSFAQTTPVVDIPLSVTDGAASRELRFGLHPTATDGIDISLGESEQPPPPPTGVFDARFIGDDIGIPAMGQGLVKDYRFGHDTTKGQRVHELKYQMGTGTIIRIDWAFPAGVTGLLQDLFGGIVVNHPMSGTGNYTVPNPGVLNKLKMTITYNLTGSPAPSAPTLLSPVNGSTNQSKTPTLSWNASSGATSYRLQVATDSLFTSVVFNDSTITTTSKQLYPLNANTKYFWRVNAKNSAGTSSYSTIWNFTTAAEIGWCNLQWPQSGTITQGGDYSVYAQIWIDGVTPGSGQGAGVSAWIGYSTTNTNPNTWTNWVPASYNASGPQTSNDEYMANIGTSLTVGTFYYASRFQYLSGEYKYGGYSTGGGGYWDGSTYVSGTLVVNPTVPVSPTLISPSNGATGLPIDPVLTWNRPANAVTFRLQVSASPTFSPLIVDQSSIFDTFFNASGLLNNTTYFWRVNATNAGGTSSYSSTYSFTTLATSIEHEGGIPERFSLSQNFPNPFNPSTTIRYSIPVESFVKIKIINAIGKIVDERINRTQSAGNYKLNWNAGNLAAGIYFYSIEAQAIDEKTRFQSVKKMILMK